MDKFIALGNSIAHTFWLIAVWFAVILLIVSVFKSISKGDMRGALMHFLNCGVFIAAIYFFPWLLRFVPHIFNT